MDDDEECGEEGQQQQRWAGEREAERPGECVDMAEADRQGEGGEGQLIGDQAVGVGEGPAVEDDRQQGRGGADPRGGVEVALAQVDRRPVSPA